MNIQKLHPMTQLLNKLTIHNISWNVPKPGVIEVVINNNPNDIMVISYSQHNKLFELTSEGKTIETNCTVDRVMEFIL